MQPGNYLCKTSSSQHKKEFARARFYLCKQSPVLHMRPSMGKHSPLKRSGAAVIELVGIHLIPVIRAQQRAYGQIQVLYCLRANV